MKQPTEGGSYVFDPKKNELKQVEVPTVHRNPNDKPAEAPVAPTTTEESGSSQQKGK